MTTLKAAVIGGISGVVTTATVLVSAVLLGDHLTQRRRSRAAARAAHPAGSKLQVVIGGAR